MRTHLALFGGLSVLGVVLNGALAAQLSVLIALERGGGQMSVEALLRDPGLAPILETSARLDPGAMLWVLAAPALVYFPVRIVFGLTIAAARGAPRS